MRCCLGTATTGGLPGGRIRGSGHTLSSAMSMSCCHRRRDLTHLRDQARSHSAVLNWARLFEPVRVRVQRVQRLRDINAATMDFLSCTQGGHPPPPEHYAVAIYPDSVYVTGDGDCYHLNLSCSGLNNANKTKKLARRRCDHCLRRP